MLQAVVLRAIQITAIDFMVTEGRRTLARQKLLVANGASHTLQSKHLTGHAVDLGALLGGAYSGDWALYHQLAAAMRKAALELGVTLTWGGVWDRTLNSLGENLGAEFAAYVARRKRAGDTTPFVDGPHFELDPAKYPMPKEA